MAHSARRQNWADISGRISLTHFVGLIDQADQGNEIVDPEAGPAG